VAELADAILNDKTNLSILGLITANKNENLPKISSKNQPVWAFIA